MIHCKQCGVNISHGNDCMCESKEKESTPEEINKYLAGVIEEKLHDLDYDGMGEYSCSCGFGIAVNDYHSDEFYKIEDELSPHRTIDYHTPSGFFKLLEYMKGLGESEFKVFCKFITVELGMNGEDYSYYIISKLLSNLEYTTFPTLCYQWLKED